MFPEKLDITCVTEIMVRDLLMRVDLKDRDDFWWAYKREELRKQELQVAILGKKHEEKADPSRNIDS
jgi:hypothetical protein